MTNEDRKRIYAALAAPFSESAIQRTSASVTGRGYDTTGIGYQFIVNRLNEVLGLGNWRTHREIEVKQITTAKGRPAYEAICDLALEFGQWDTEGKFIPFAEALADGGHTAMSEADAKKGSFTNALKKAAAMLGCGKQAYEGSLDDDNTAGVQEPQEPATQPQTHAPRPLTQNPVPPAPVAQQPPTASAGPLRNRLTSKQLAALWAMARKAGHDQSQFRQMVKQQAGVQPEFLSREVASRFISDLAAQLGNGHASSDARQPGQEG